MPWTESDVKRVVLEDNTLSNMVGMICKVAETPKLDSTIKMDADGMPCFILTIGPPASGKSSSLHVILELLGIDSKDHKSVLEINVDKYVEQQELWGKTAQSFKETIKELGASNMAPEAMEAICLLGQKFYLLNRGPADHKSNSKLLSEMMHAYDVPKTKRRHVVYETTGSLNAYDWAMKVGAMAAAHGYRPIVIYPMVLTVDLYRRSQQRAADIGRLPCPTIIRTFAVQAFESVLKIVELAKKGAGPYTRVFLLDNTKESPRFIGAIEA